MAEQRAKPPDTPREPLQREGRFVILRHEPGPASERPLHWDLMLETSGGLRTWALAEEPQVKRPIAATELPLHRPVYLTYEGPVSGARGMVTRWDQGMYRMLTSGSAGCGPSDIPSAETRLEQGREAASGLSTVEPAQASAPEGVAPYPTGRLRPSEAPESAPDQRPISAIRLWLEGARLRGMLELNPVEQTETAAEGQNWIVRWLG